MARQNMFDNIFEKAASEPASGPEQAARLEQPREPAKADGLFCLKDIPETDRKPTTIIFSKRNLAFLKKMAIDENANMSELVNRWLEGLQAQG